MNEHVYLYSEGVFAPCPLPTYYCFIASSDKMLIMYTTTFLKIIATITVREKTFLFPLLHNTIAFCYKVSDRI